MKERKKSGYFESPWIHIPTFLFKKNPFISFTNDARKIWLVASSGSLDAQIIFFRMCGNLKLRLLLNSVTYIFLQPVFGYY
ncbi:unnamed protein product [Rhizophagus irregularis]|nr:unnamed protein product [Rhizophagus irregularis]